MGGVGKLDRASRWSVWTLCLVFAESPWQLPGVTETAATNLVGHGVQDSEATFPGLVMAAHLRGDCVPGSPPFKVALGNLHGDRFRNLKIL